MLKEGKVDLVPQEHNMIVKVLLFIWQLPQNLLGLIVKLVTRAVKADRPFEHVSYLSKKRFGVALGDYMLFGVDIPNEDDYNHEYGHHIQSTYLGPLYLLIIGLPSISFNIYDSCCHKDWRFEDRYAWYYNLPWEKWADKLGGVKR